jgi:putative phosphoesterase
MTREIGVISDTHGLLRGQVKSRLQGCVMILHAGDIGGPSVLSELGQIAPVVAVRGNADTGAWARALNRVEYREIEGTHICIVHDLGTLDLDPAAAGIDVVVYGHSHQPAIEHEDGILYLNPGSAGPKRFRLPVSMALLHLGTEGMTPELIQL